MNIANDSTYNEQIRQYAQHRYELCHDTTQTVFEKYNRQKLLYMESTVVHPGFRCISISQSAQRRVYQDYGAQYGVLVEGQVPAHLLESGKVKTLEQTVPGVDGFVNVKSIHSHDDFIVVVTFRAPKPV